MLNGCWRFEILRPTPVSSTDRYITYTPEKVDWMLEALPSYCYRSTVILRVPYSKLQSSLHCAGIDNTVPTQNKIINTPTPSLCNAKNITITAASKSSNNDNGNLLVTTHVHVLD